MLDWIAMRARRLKALPGRVNHAMVQTEYVLPPLLQALQHARLATDAVLARVDQSVHALSGQISVLADRIDVLSSRIHAVNGELDALRSRLDIEDALFERFQAERRLPEYQAPYLDARPLVSICIGTYNRGPLLIERSLRSALAQDYPAIEVIVVGDACTDDTAALMALVTDERVRFVNLPDRGAYPEEPDWRWMVAGTTPFNHALMLARGDFITHLDDDDEHPPDRISKLLAFLRETRADLVFHPFWSETASGDWALNPASSFRKAEVTTSSVLYHRWFRQVPWDMAAYHYGEPGDWNRFRKLRYLGARTARFPEPLLRHYRERNQRAGER